MVDHERFVTVLAEFAHTLACGYEISDVLYRLADTVVDVLGTAGAGVSLVDNDGLLRAATAINALSSIIEQAEEDHQQGPCIEAHRAGRSVAVSDLASRAAQWPDYVAIARRHGVVAVLAVPVSARRSILGTLNTYGTEPRDWSDDETVARTLADVAAGYLLHASELERAQRTAEQLQRAVDSRVIIEQAKGVLANHYSVSVEEAFTILRRHARSHNANLAATAEAIVHLGLRPPPR